MSSVQLGSGFNIQKGNLGGAFDILSGASGDYTDLGIGRRFGGSAAAYSLRDIGAMNGPVVKVRREPQDTTDAVDDEQNFSASQVDSGALEDWVNGKFENTLPADVDTAAAAYSLRKVRAGYSNNAVQIRRSSDQAEVDVAFDSDGKVSNSSLVTDVTEESESGGTQVASSGATTLADFLNPGGSGTDAFVVTWYDQSPSGNDITQTTSANQPKIAESGALLADGVDFDGSASYLDATSALGATATIGAFIVHKPDDTDENQYLIDNRDGTGDGMRIMQRSDADGNYRFSMDSTDVNSASGSVTTNETLLTAIQSSTAATLFKNAVQQATAADDAISVTAAFRIGANRVSTGTYFDGTMKEIILFTSDQTDDRFKIESNINNYYGLYNDENETSDSAFQFQDERSGGVSVADGLNGFTLDTQTAAAFAGIQLNGKVASGESIFVSCNITTLTAGSATASPRCQLRKSTLGGTDGSNFVNLTLGFNSFTLTSTDSDVEFVSFSEGDDNTIFTLTDFKVSRIARNGFVHTWYDQSSNGNDATQGTAANQPAIVTNGGLESGLSFDGTNDFLQTSTQVLTGTETGSNGIYAVVNVTSGDAGYVAGSASDNSGGGDAVGQSIYASSASSKFILTNGLDADASERDTIAITVGSFVLVSACYNDNDPDTLQKDSSTTGYTNGSLAYNFNAGTKFTIGHRERSGGVNPATNLNGTIKEVIAFDIDTTSDRSEIQADIQNHYNL
jgi:hypothetical protein